MLKKMSFRNIIILGVFGLYFLSSFFIFYSFNNSYLENVKRKFIEQNNYSAFVAKELLEKEKQNLINSAREYSRSDTLYNALKYDIYIGKDKWDIGKDTLTMKYYPADKLSYMNILSSGNRAENVQLEIFKNESKLSLKIGTKGLKKEETDTGEEKYLQDVLGDGLVRVLELGIIEEKAGEFFIKGISPVGFNTRWVPIGQATAGNIPGVVVAIKRIDGGVIDEIKKITNCEIVIVKNNEIKMSTIFSGTERVVNVTSKTKVEFSEKYKYLEMNLENRKIGVTFIPVYSYDGKSVLFYIGTGFFTDALESENKRITSSFIFMETLFAIILLIALYLLLRVLFKPFNKVITAIKEISEGKYSTRLNVENSKELKILSDGINILASTVDTRERDLKELNQTLEVKVKERTEEIENNMDKLKKIQEKLVASEKIASVGKLAGGIAHEINSPLVAILTNAQLIQQSIEKIEDKVLKVELEESRQDIEDAVKKSKYIISKLLGFTERHNRKIEKIDISDITDSIRDLFGDEFKKEGIKFELDIENNLVVEGNFDELVEVFRNVVANAKDAVIKKDESNKVISIYGYEYANKITIVITDNGIGMTKEVAAKIFDQFFTTKEEGEGLGLGLAMCPDILKKHGATIQVDSEPSVGTKIIIEMPKA